jgi:hypothetical protein
MRKLSLVLLGLSLSTLGTFAYGEDKPTMSSEAKQMAREAKGKKAAMMEMTPEQRKTMATAHEQMAQCLRSDKPMTECRQAMRASCDMNGEMGCGMMGHHKGEMKGQGRKAKGME